MNNKSNIYKLAVRFVVIQFLLLPITVYGKDSSLADAYNSVMELNRGKGSVVNATELLRKDKKYYKLFYISSRGEQKTYIFDAKTGKLITD